MCGVCERRDVGEGGRERKGGRGREGVRERGKEIKEKKKNKRGRDTVRSGTLSFPFLSSYVLLCSLTTSL